MQGEAHWLVGIVILTGAAAIALLVLYARRVFERFRAHPEALRCPETGELVDCIVEVDLAERSAPRVVRCARLEDPNDVRCDMACLKSGPR